MDSPKPRPVTSLTVLLVLAVVAVLCLQCVAPDQHDETKWSTVTVGFGPSLRGDALPFRDDQLTELRKQIRTLWALGPTFTEAPEGSAQWILRPFDSGPGCANGVGRYLPGTRFMECDVVCAHGYGELRTCLAHELGHALGMKHICRQSGELTDCSPVGYGPAIMNPSGIDTDPFEPMPAIGYVPTDLDLAEFRRTRP